MCDFDGLISIHHILWIKEPLLRTAKLYWLIDLSELQSKEEKHQTRVAGQRCVWCTAGFSRLMQQPGINRSFPMRS